MRFVATLLQAVIGLALIALIWWGAASLQGAPAGPFPGPAEVVNKTAELLAADAFQQHAWASLAVLLYGLVPALLVGIVIGAAARASTAARWLFGPLVVTLAAAPLFVLLPLLVSWLGSNFTPKVVLVFLVAAFAVANTITTQSPRRHPGIIGADGAAPSRAHAIVAGLRVGIVLGVGTLVATELVMSNTGIGYFVGMSGSLFNTTDAMAAALAILVPTIAVGVILQAIEEQLAR